MHLESLNTKPQVKAPSQGGEVTACSGATLELIG
tara:strand:- start:156 stop:257 length:102 start_codon:yes stop_codon:yes gene_type:complete